MNRKIWLVPCLAAIAGACGDDDPMQQPGTPDAAPVTPTADAAPAKPADLDVTEDVTQDTTWFAATRYHLKQKAGDNKYVVVHPGATLTVEAGARIFGADGTALIVARGGALVAAGTAASPIVFTHDAPDGQRQGGKWGGIVILGRAPTNLAGNNTLFEALPDSIGDIGKFGGNDANDNSGVLRYVRIEFGGFSYITNREFNGLTLCGVGAGTVIDHVQVHRGTDDGIELFGGTVNLKHVVITQNEDDGLDTDNGWTGKAQFVIVQDLIGSTTDGSHGYESDNHAAPDTNYDNQPRTNFTIYNATLIGSTAITVPHFGMVLRRGTSGKLYNHVITGFASAAMEIRDAATATQATAGNIVLESSVIFGNRADGSNWSTAQADYDESKYATSPGNRSIDPMIEDMTNLGAPKWKPMTGSPLMSGAATPPDDGFFDPTATFVGAVGSVDWTAGWTAYPAN